MKHGTSYIQPEEKSILNRLRISEQKNVQDENSLLWGKADEEALVLGVWKRNELIASMRLEIIPDINSLEKIISSKTPKEILEENNTKFPAGVLSKAVTSSKLKDDGLNALLRYHLLKIAVDNQIQDIFGTLAKDSGYAPHLKQMGYEFFHHPSPSPVEIIYLNLAKNKKLALETCAKLASNSLLLYPWISTPQ